MCWVDEGRVDKQEDVQLRGDVSVGDVAFVSFIMTFCFIFSTFCFCFVDVICFYFPLST